MSYNEVLINCGMLTFMKRLVFLKDGGSGCSLDYRVPACSPCLQGTESPLD